MKTPELWNPLPFQVDEATTLRWIPVLGPALLGGGSPGPPAGAGGFDARLLLLPERKLGGRTQSRLGRGDDRDLPGHELAVQQAREAVRPGRGGAREMHGESLVRVEPAAVVVGLRAIEVRLFVL